MTTDPVTYRTFWTVFIQDGPTLRSTFRTFSDLARVRGLRSRIATLFIIFTMVFILAFPTLASSMTGYSASNQPWVKTDDINQVPFSEFRKVSYPNGTEFFEYGVKAYDPKYFDDRAVCQPVVEQNQQQQQQKYQWGFSFIQLEIVLCLLTLWTVGIHIMWSTAYLRSIKMGMTYNDPGNFKSAIIMADSIRKEFKQKTNKDITFFTEKELMSSIKTHLNGGQVMLKSVPLIPE